MKCLGNLCIDFTLLIMFFFSYSKLDDMKECIHNFLLGITPCMARREVHARYTVERMSETVLGFVCENEGDHIARKYHYLLLNIFLIRR